MIKSQYINGFLPIPSLALAAYVGSITIGIWHSAPASGPTKLEETFELVASSHAIQLSVSALAERPLFNANRRHAKTNPKLTSTSALPAESTFSLVGTLHEGGRTFALIRSTGNESLLRLFEGGRAGEWIVHHVDLDSVALISEEGESRLLSLDSATK